MYSLKILLVLDWFADVIIDVIMVKMCFFLCSKHQVILDQYWNLISLWVTATTSPHQNDHYSLWSIFISNSMKIVSSTHTNDKNLGTISYLDILTLLNSYFLWIINKWTSSHRLNLVSCFDSDMTLYLNDFLFMLTCYDFIKASFYKNYYIPIYSFSIQIIFIIFS